MWTLLLSLLLAGQAAEPDALGCVVDKVPAAERIRIADRVLSGPDAGADRSLDAAVEACVAQGLIPAEARDLTTTTVAATFTGIEAQKRLAVVGIDAQVINRWFEALPDDQRSDPVSNEESVGRLVELLVQAGADAKQVDANAELIGSYIGAISVLDGLVQATAR
jgi:hypothetical protein